MRYLVCNTPDMNSIASNEISFDSKSRQVLITGLFLGPKISGNL